MTELVIRGGRVEMSGRDGIERKGERERERERERSLGVGSSNKVVKKDT